MLCAVVSLLTCLVSVSLLSPPQKLLFQPPPPASHPAGERLAVPRTGAGQGGGLEEEEGASSRKKKEGGLMMDIKASCPSPCTPDQPRLGRPRVLHDHKEAMHVGEEVGGGCCGGVCCTECLGQMEEVASLVLEEGLPRAIDSLRREKGEGRVLGPYGLFLVCPKNKINCNGNKTTRCALSSLLINKSVFCFLFLCAFVSIPIS